MGYAQSLHFRCTRLAFFCIGLALPLHKARTSAANKGSRVRARARTSARAHAAMPGRASADERTRVCAHAVMAACVQPYVHSAASCRIPLHRASTSTGPRTQKHSVHAICVYLHILCICVCILYACHCVHVILCINILLYLYAYSLHMCAFSAYCCGLKTSVLLQRNSNFERIVRK